MMLQPLGVLSQLVSEAMLSLYPVFVKNIGLSLQTQMWSRFVSYTLISALFINKEFIFKHLRNGWGALLAFVTLAHIYTSYRGFQILPSGTAFTIFYIYPVLILLLTGKLTPVIAIPAIIGVALLGWGESVVGIGMTFLAALTEAVIFFIVLRLPTKNNWNHIFLSYFAGAFLLSIYGVYKGDFFEALTSNRSTLKSLAINSVLGLFGYYLRFYAISRVPVFVFALIANVGIVMSYAYGYYFNGETVDIKQIIGAVLVAAACLLGKH